MECVKNIDRILAPRVGEKITSTDITDLMNVIGKWRIDVRDTGKKLANPRSRFPRR